LGRVVPAVAVAACLTLGAAGAAWATEPTGGAAPPGPPAGGQQPVQGMPPIPYAAEIAAAADQHGVERLLFAALVRVESNFDPMAASGAGAVGLTQLMPGTARLMGLAVNPKNDLDERTDPGRSLDGGAHYLHDQLAKFGRIKLALAAYNGGPRVIRARRMPTSPGIRAYVKRVLQYRAAYRQGRTEPPPPPPR
jgi:soluble lytic murein transglycosylase-like protein